MEPWERLEEVGGKRNRTCPPEGEEMQPPKGFIHIGSLKLRLKNARNWATGTVGKHQAMTYVDGLDKAKEIIMDMAGEARRKVRK